MTEMELVTTRETQQDSLQTITIYLWDIRFS